MNILGKFGFDPILFIAQIVNFLILAYVFKRFLYKPLLKVLKERQDKIKKGIEDAQKAEDLMKKTEEGKNEILKRTRIEAENIIEDSRKIAEEQKNRIIEDSRKESEKIVKQAKDQAQLEIEIIEKKISNISLNLSKKMLDNILESLFTEKEKNEILKRALQKIENYEKK